MPTPRDYAGCHGARGEGRAELFYPMIAAQHHGYLLRELRLTRDGERGNSNAAVRTVGPTWLPGRQIGRADA